MRVILKMTKSYKNLNAGEIAGFEPDEAEHILKHNGGVRVEEKPAPQPAKK